MKIVISDIPEEGLVVDLEERFGAEGLSFSSPVKAQLFVSTTEQEVLVTGTVEVELETECSRCLASIREAMNLEVCVVYHPADEVDSAKHELHDDEMDMGFYQGDELDLQELIREQITLNKQMKPLCKEDCKGICPKCGVDLNAGTCTCIQKETDPRLEVLRKLLDKGKE